MKKVSSTPLNKTLYAKVKRLANKKFKSPTGVYRSSWIVKEYIKRGGKYSGKKTKTSGLLRWYSEKWVDLKRPIKKSGKIIGYKSCGRSKRSSKRYPLCRPTLRINKKTPRVYSSISKKTINKLKQQKTSARRVQFGKGPQFRGRSSKVMVSVPELVKKSAKYAFQLKKLGFHGATSTGWRRAKQLATKSEIPIEDLRYMRNWFARHIYTSYPGFKKWKLLGRPKTKEHHNKHAILSWLTWAGDQGFRWVNSDKNIKKLNKHFNKNYKKIKKH